MKIIWLLLGAIYFAGLFLCLLHLVYYIKKHQDLVKWMERHQAAVDRLWESFKAKPVTEQSIRWMERNHARLMRVKPPE